MTDTYEPSSSFVRPDEIRCTATQVVHVAETRPIFSSATTNAYLTAGDKKGALNDSNDSNNSDYVSRSDLPYADYDTIFSAALDLHLMEIGSAVSPCPDHHFRELSEPPYYHLMDPLLTNNSNWTEDVRKAQNIIDQNVADMLATKLRTGQRVEATGCDDKAKVVSDKKSFVVEFTSAREYEQFLEFKNKLTASSCSSPSGDDDCLASSLYSHTSRVIFEESYQRGNQAAAEKLVSIIEPRAENESYQLSSTPPSVSSSLSSDSSSYLATLTEEDEDEEEVEEAKLEDHKRLLLRCPPPVPTNSETEAIQRPDITEQLTDIRIERDPPIKELTTPQDETSTSLNGTAEGEECATEAGAFFGACPLRASPSKESKQMQIPVEAELGGETSSRDVKRHTDSARSTTAVTEHTASDGACDQSTPVIRILAEPKDNLQVNNRPFVSNNSTGIVPSKTTFPGPSSTSSSLSKASWRATEADKNRIVSNLKSSACNSDSCDSHSCSSLDCDCDLLNESSGYVCAEENLCTQNDDDVCKKSNSSISRLPTESSLDCECCSDKLRSEETSSASASPFTDSYQNKRAADGGLHNNKSCCCYCCSCQEKSSANNNNNTIGECSSRFEEGVGISNNEEDSYDANVTFFSCCSDDNYSSPLGEVANVTTSSCQLCDKSDTDNLNESVCLELPNEQPCANLKGSSVANTFPSFSSHSVSVAVARQISLQEDDRAKAGTLSEADTSEGAISSPSSKRRRRCEGESEFGFVKRPHYLSSERVNVGNDDVNGSGDKHLGLRPSSSTSSLNSSFSENSASFVASNRLKRLEERLKKFHYAKKLISDPQDHGQTEGNSIWPVSDEDDDEQAKLISEIRTRLQENGTQNESVCTGGGHENTELVCAETTKESLDKNNNSVPSCLLQDSDNANGLRQNTNPIRRGSDYDEAVTRFGGTPSPTESLLDNNKSSGAPEHLLYDSDDISQCTFNVANYYPEPPLTIHDECYDELIDEQQAEQVQLEESCDCVLEAYPLCYINKPGVLRGKYAEMRENTGPLRGLLKKPNRPPQQRKNRVVFDETRNEFFDADYIILIREDCPYDEEDEEPCTCGEHELVRLCCEEGCQCPGYIEGDGKTPQVRK